MLINISKTLHITYIHFIQVNCLHKIKKYSKGGVAQISTVFGVPHHLAS